MATQPQKPAPRPAPASTAGATVTVASKLPMRLRLQLEEFHEVRLPDGRGGYVIETNARKVGPVVVINGTAYPRGEPPEGFRDRPEMLQGFALTPGVPREFWERWVKQKAGFPPLESGLLFAHESRADVAAEARGMRDTRSDLDPMQVGKAGAAIKDPRLPRPISGIELKGEAGPTDLDTAA